MKSPLNLTVCMMFALIRIAYGDSVPTPVAMHGETLVAGMLGKLPVQIKISTHELQIGKPSDERPAVIQTNCTYSRYPCTLVDRIDIIVNGSPLFVPRSVFADLADLKKASLVKLNEKKSLLRLDGGDGSDGFIVNIEFDASRVLRRTLSPGSMPDKPLQETVYNVVTEG
jgi:hypothetical protein